MVETTQFCAIISTLWAPVTSSIRCLFDFPAFHVSLYGFRQTVDITERTFNVFKRTTNGYSRYLEKYANTNTYNLLLMKRMTDYSMEMRARI